MTSPERNTMRLSPAPLAALLLAITLAIAALPPHGAWAQSDYSQAKLESFVKAALHVEAILTRWTPQIKRAEGAQKEAIKRQVDGALGAHGAWLLEPYADRPDSLGLVLESEEVGCHQRALRH